MARVAGEVSSIPNLPSQVSAVGAKREAGRGAEAACRASVRTRQVESGRGVRGCNLREREKGGFAIGPTRRGKGTKIIAIAADNSLPLAVSVESASPAECKLVEDVLAGSFLDQLPARLIGDKAYDSDPLDEKLATEYGIELIAPIQTWTKAQNPGWPPATPLSQTMESREALCMDAQLPTTRYSMGIPHRKLPRIRPSRLSPHDAQTFMRLLLVFPFALYW